MNDVTGARRVGHISAARQRREAQADDTAAHAREMEARPNVPPRAPNAAHPWAVQPGENCKGRTMHDFTMKGKDGLYRCWHCTTLSPRSRAKQGPA